jgi:hypothetical protein
LGLRKHVADSTNPPTPKIMTKIYLVKAFATFTTSTLAIKADNADDAVKKAADFYGGNFLSAFVSAVINGDVARLDGTALDSIFVL